MAKTILQFILICGLLFPLSMIVFSQNSKKPNASEKDTNSRLGICKSDVQNLLPNRRNGQEFLKKAGQVSSVLEELEKYREDFLRTGNLINLFPALYFHTTYGEFKNILLNESEHPIEMLDMIIAFYDAYKMNRELFEKGGVKAVEPHWRNYYKRALKGNKEKSKSFGLITEILLDGIDAHVIYDLPRAIRFKISGRQTALAEIKAEFDKMDFVFSEASEGINQDIVNGLKASNLLLFLDKTFNLGPVYVIYGRKKAWELAVSEKRLPTKKSQPEYLYNPDSRNYFSKEFLERYSAVCKSENNKAAKIQ